MSHVNKQQVHHSISYFIIITVLITNLSQSVEVCSTRINFWRCESLFSILWSCHSQFIGWCVNMDTQWYMCVDWLAVIKTQCKLFHRSPAQTRLSVTESYMLPDFVWIVCVCVCLSAKVHLWIYIYSKQARKPFFYLYITLQKLQSA